MFLGIGIGLTARRGGVPPPPPGYIYLTDDNGAYLTDDGGTLLLGTT